MVERDISLFMPRYTLSTKMFLTTAQLTETIVIKNKSKFFTAMFDDNMKIFVFLLNILILLF